MKKQFLYIFIFSFLFFLTSNSETFAVGFRMWEQDVPIIGELGAAVYDPIGQFFYVAGEDKTTHAPKVAIRIEKRRVSDGKLCTVENCGASSFNTTGFNLWGEYAGNWPDEAKIRTMAIDASGNIYIGGYVKQGLMYNPMVIKYSSLGVYLASGNDTTSNWYRSVKDITIVNGYIMYVIYDGDRIVKKVDVRTMGGSTFIGLTINVPQDVIFTSIASSLETNGEYVYVGGYQNVNAGVRWYIQKMSYLGVKTWEKTSNYVSSVSVINDFSLYNANDLYLIGHSSDGTEVIERRRQDTGALVAGSHCPTLFCTSGILKTPSFFGSSGYARWAKSIVVDISGMYVVGKESVVPSTTHAWYLEKRDEYTGTLLWRQSGSSFSSTTNPSANALILDTSKDPSDIYVAGIGNDNGWRIEKTAQNLDDGGVVRAVHMTDLQKEVDRVKAVRGVTTASNWSAINSGSVIRGDVISKFVSAVNSIANANCASTISEASTGVIRASTFNNISLVLENFASGQGFCSLVNNNHTSQECASAGGSVVDDGGGYKFCKFTASSCSSITGGGGGWQLYNNWSTTQNKSGTYSDGIVSGVCNSSGAIGQYCTNINHTCTVQGHSTFSPQAPESITCTGISENARVIVYSGAGNPGCADQACNGSNITLKAPILEVGCY